MNRPELILEDCVNIAALDNGYADRHGLPFPKDAKHPKHASGGSDAA